ncbi:MAG: ParA family protein, partial [Bacteroidota bacterium]
MGIVISLLNHKGGVGKTTSAVNIGAAMVELGKRVLLIDLDPQANLTVSLGIPRQKVTIYEALRGESEVVPFSCKPNLDVVVSSLDLSGAEMELINEAGREFILRELLAQVADDYDFVIIDCPPSLGLLTLN